MSGEDATPQELLGDELWSTLGAAETPAVPEGMDARIRARIAQESGREALGDEVWDALGAVPDPVAPAWSERAPRPRRQGPGWRAWVAVALAAGLTFVAVPALRGPEPMARADDLALVRDLALAQNLELLSSPDFELLMQWNGEVP